MMGACFECLVDIDGVTRQACMVGVSEGLVVNRLATAEEPDADL
jgi:predicted molibdopterin-dependent oxidoreductase YjgC